MSRGLGSTRSSPGLPIVMSRESATNESTSKDSNIVSNEKSCLDFNQPLVNCEKVKVKEDQEDLEDPHIKNHVAFTRETTLKPNNQCSVEQSPEEKANLKADTAAIRSTSTVPYDEREVSPIFDDNFIEHAFSNWPEPAAKHSQVPSEVIAAPPPPGSPGSVILIKNEAHVNLSPSTQQVRESNEVASKNEQQSQDANNVTTLVRPPRKPPDLEKSNTLNDRNSKEVLVRQSVGLNLTIPVEINEIPTDAIVDSAAQVTLISRNLLVQITIPIEIIGKVELRGVGNSCETIPADKIEGVLIKVGHKQCSWPVYAADVTDPVLLGLDFLVKNKCKVDFVNNEIILPDEIIVATLKKGTEGNTCDIFKVISVHHQCIPPNTKLKIPVQVLNAKPGITQYVVEPGRNLKGLVASNAIIPPHGYIDVINDSSHNIIVKYQQHIGTALEMTEILTPWLATNSPNINSTGVNENSSQQLPECSV